MPETFLVRDVIFSQEIFDPSNPKNSWKNFLVRNGLRPSFMGIGFGSGILLDLVLFADRIIAEPKSNRSILWDMEVFNDLNGVCAFF